MSSRVKVTGFQPLWFIFFFTFLIYTSIFLAYITILFIYVCIISIVIVVGIYFYK